MTRPGPRRRPPPEIAHLPVCPHRLLPIPYIAEVAPDGTGHFTVLDDTQAARCLKYRLCAMCGRPMGDEVALIGDEVSLLPGSFWVEPPVHERCGEIALDGWCPYLSLQNVPRRPPDADMAIIGMSPDELPDVGRSIPKRPLAMAIARRYTAALAPAHGGTHALVYQVRPGQVVRTRRFEYGPDGRIAETGAAAATAEPEPPARPAVRAVRTPRRNTRNPRRK